MSILEMVISILTLAFLLTIPALFIHLFIMNKIWDRNERKFRASCRMEGDYLCYDDGKYTWKTAPEDDTIRCCCSKTGKPIPEKEVPKGINVEGMWIDEKFMWFYDEEGKPRKYDLESKEVSSW